MEIVQRHRNLNQVERGVEESPRSFPGGKSCR
jgi:hypothetical protein